VEKSWTPCAPRWTKEIPILSLAFFFLETHLQTQTLTYTSANLPLWRHVRTLYSYERLIRTELDWQISRLTPLNPGINPGKYEHPCQVGDLNPNRQVSPQETQPTKELCSVCLSLAYIVWCSATVTVIEEGIKSESCCSRCFYAANTCGHLQQHETAASLYISYHCHFIMNILYVIDFLFHIFFPPPFFRSSPTNNFIFWARKVWR
jgi:hypothetical protein